MRRMNSLGGFCLCWNSAMAGLVMSEGASLFRPTYGGKIGKLGELVLYISLVRAEMALIVVYYLYWWVLLLAP